MRCDNCKFWITVRKTVYQDKSEIVSWQSAGNDGKCTVLGIDTAPDFGCSKFVEGSVHEQVDKKYGVPWQHWRMGECPQCRGDPGAHGGVRCRCAGTALVRYYDDGYVGEEQTRLHPQEKELIAKRGHQNPICEGCKTELSPSWVACPYCGFRAGKMAEIELVGEGNSGVVGTM